MSGGLKPLGELKGILDDNGFGVSYAYDDLVFGEHSDFLMKFDGDNVYSVDLYTHVEHNAEARKDLLTRMHNAFEGSKFDITDKGAFDVKEKEGAAEEVNIHFFDA